MKTFWPQLGLGCAALFLSGCTGNAFWTAPTYSNSASDHDGHYQVATNVDQVQTQVVTEYVPVPLPGQLMLKDKGKNLKGISKQQFKTKEAAVAYANKEALRYPNTQDYFNSIMTYTYMNGAVYMVYTAPAKMTDIEFQPGETLISQAAGDTLRWRIGKTYSGEGATRREHLLIKPTEPDLSNNMVVTTNRRVYHIKLMSTGNDQYMEAVRWTYPAQMVTHYRQASASASPAAPSGGGYQVDISNMNTEYKVTAQRGNTKNWMPTLVFNNGKHTYIRFPVHVFSHQMPILMIDTGNDQYSSTVNYRIKGQYMVVDGLFSRARLMLGNTLDDNLSEVQIDYLARS